MDLEYMYATVIRRQTRFFYSYKLRIKQNIVPLFWKKSMGIPVIVLHDTARPHPLIKE